MFGFMRKSAVQRPSEGICRALQASGLPPGCSDPAADFRVVEQHGRYSGRKVTHVRIFDPAAVAAREVVVRGYGDLDAHPDLILWTGRVEQDGAVSLIRLAAARSIRLPATREPANRASHGDVEHLLDRSSGG